MTNHKILSFVKYKTIDNWSVSHIVGNKMWFNDLYPMVSIGDIIEKATNTIEIQDEAQYKQVTLKTNGGGAVLRDVKYGREIGTKKQYVVSEGQFIMSKIDARNGAFGVITKELDGAIVTADFPVFNVNTEIVLPQYLFLLSSSKRFAQFAQSCSRGTTNRQRIDVGLFLSQQIPLPPLSEQHRLFNEFEANMQQATDNERRAAEIERDIEKYLLDELGILKPNASVNNKQDGFNFMRFVSFKNIDRWDTTYFMQSNKFETKFDYTTLGKCLDCFMTEQNGKSLRAETFKSPDNSFSYIGMENIEKQTGVLQNFHNVIGKDIKSQTVRVPKGFFLYGKLRPYLNKYWYNETDVNNIVCSSEFFVFSIKDSINPYYFKYYISSSAVQKQIEKLFQGARMPRINEQTFKSIKIPLAPIEVQNEIANHISNQEIKIKQLKQMASDLRATAMTAFENQIFEQ
ncbi:MAG: restriction endonuclease subunit S [Bacteroidales bacterium]|nr:restriction endonuclease subunit S [Bacteroidales bacterium]